MASPVDGDDAWTSDSDIRQIGQNPPSHEAVAENTQLQPSSSDNPLTKVWDLCFSKLQELHKASPAGFCPHMQATSERFRRPKWLKNGVDDAPTLECKTCGSSITCVLAPQDEIDEDSGLALKDQVSSISYTGNFEVIVGQWDPDEEGWISRLDPKSYGHFSDSMTKHITWCDDGECATTYELLRFTNLVWLAKFRNYDSAMESFKRDPKQWLAELDQATDKSIKFSKASCR